MASVDLHLHTTASDGGLAPSRLVDLAADNGLAALSITDHDTMAGLPEAGARALETDLQFIPGVELSIDLHCGGSVHLLGYFPGKNPVSWEGGSLEKALERVRQARRARNDLIISRLNDLGIPVTREEVQDLSGGGVTGRLHIAMLLIQKGVVKTTDQAFKNYLGSGASAYVPRERLGDYRALHLIRTNGGIPVLAHPGLIPGRSTDELRALTASLVDGGLMGLEAFYPMHDPGMTGFLLRTAGEMNLLVTGGSDFHGMNRTDEFPMNRNGFRVEARAVSSFLEACEAMKGASENGETQ